MKTFACLCLLLLLCLSHNQSVSAQTATPNVALTWSRDGRLVRDAAALRLDQISAEQSWVVANVKPDKDSPGGREVGVYFDRTGNLVQEPGVRQFTITTEHGSISSVTILAGTPQVPTPYRLEYERKARLRMEGEHYSIFRAGPGGTAVFRVNEQAEGTARFSPAYLIADEWAPFVAPALQYVGANRELFAPKDAQKHQTKLQALLGDQNPFIAIAAARALGEAQLLDADFMQKTVAQATGLRQSVLVYVAFRQLPTAELPSALRREISKIIGAAKDAPTLQALTMGIIAVLHNSPRDYLITRERVERLMRQVAQRQAALKTRTEADLYLDQTLKLMGLTPEPQNVTQKP